ncbi:disease resistance protein RUN1-like [Syzygium oleosum]|uniref:disease resistance protein RUN1-like n=1 Tax=Syzygium oleosum TaxID=219896 RepID=UPI0024BA37A4|nr:disease resistance protein RUN1-like [Syzygium oleosum]
MSGYSSVALVAPVLLLGIAYKHLHRKKASKSEVFLSFSGEDALKMFANSLCKGMVDAGICVFRSDDWLSLGEKIGPDPFQAIKGSKISIPILSPKYASSRWCLDELVQIMKCKNDSSGHVVLPIFYGVKPADVRCEIDGWDAKIVEEWERALTEVSSLKGWEWERVADGDGGQLVVRKVLMELKKALEQFIAENPVGIKSPVKEIMEFVDDSRASTLYVVIHGESGVGKTTLAKVIFNKLSDQFDHCSFIPNVRESCKCNAIEHLQSQLIMDILKEKVQVYDKDEGITVISSRFKGKKILILLDDVDANHQLEALVGERNWFASGSRVIITTRNKSVLDWAKVDYAYEHKEMDEDAAKILLARHAFRSDSLPSELSTIPHDVVLAIRRFPLIVEVIGSYLCGKSRESWENTRNDLQQLQNVRDSRKLDKLQQLKQLQESQESQESQDNQALRLLQLSQQSQLLQEWQESQVSPELQVLAKWQELQQLQELHQLRELQKLPQMEVQEILKMVFDALKSEQKKIFLDIACVLVGSDARIASCMWDASDSHQVLGIEELRFLSLIKIGDNHELRMHDELRDLGRSIVLEGNGNELDKGSRMWEYEEALKVLEKNTGTDNIQALSLNKGNSNGGQSYTYEQFKNLEGLRFLHVSDASFLGDFKKIFSKLRWFRWERCPRSLEAENFGAKELAVLDLSRSNISDDWIEWNSIMAAKKLKVLNLTGCSSLTSTFFLSDLKKLEILILRNCDGLKNILPSIGDLKTLVSLDLSGCSSLKKLPEEVGNLVGLKELLLDRTKIQEIPSFIGSLKKLEMLSAKECEFLVQLPDSRDPVNLLTIVSLDLPRLDSIGSLVKLRRLSLQSCRHLRWIPNSIGQMESLTELVLTKTTITVLPDSIENLQNLGILNISSTSIKELPNAIGRLRKLRKLDASKCTNLSKVISSFRDLYSLQHLDLIGCVELQSLPELPSNLTVVGVTCKSVTLRSFSHLIHLKKLRLHNCTFLKYIPKLPSTLLELEVSGCEALQLLTPLKGFKVSLERLNIIRCKSLGELDLSRLNHLRVLHAQNCGNIQEIRGLDRLNDLKSLTIQGHPPIELDEPFLPIGNGHST